MLKNKFFAGILKVNDENSVRGMDPRIRIRIHPKISWIRNTGEKYTFGVIKSFEHLKNL